MLVQQIVKRNGSVVGLVVDGSVISYGSAVDLYNKGLLCNVTLVNGKYFRGKRGIRIPVKEEGSYENKRNAGNMGQIYGEEWVQRSNRRGVNCTTSGFEKKKEFNRGGKRGSEGADGYRGRQRSSNFGVDAGIRLRLNKLGCRCYAQVSAKDFRRDFISAKVLHPNSSCVDTHTEEELNSMKCLRTENGFVAVETDGNINSVLKDVSKPNCSGFLRELLLNAVINGTRKLDCFAIMSDKRGGLADMYCRHGFVPVVRDRFNREFAPDNWDYDKDDAPDVVFMYYCGDAPEVMMEKSKAGKYKWYLDYTVPYIQDVKMMKEGLKKNSSYDMCLLYRDWVMEHSAA